MANIKNVNILADGKYLEQAQEITTGKEFKHNKTYNFQPIYEAGVFHPKIMLLTGKKHGLLIIGSGNLTSSGLSTNDEIWGAFHLDNVGNENAPLFGAVWTYLQYYLNQSLGFVTQKINWMRKQSPWLAELPVSNDWISLKEPNIQLKFIANTAEQSTYSQLASSISNSDIEAMTIVSPYYDKSGQELAQLKSHFSPVRMNCLIDSNSGIIPTEMDKTISDQINFYDWADCKADYETTYNRLHAKLIHIRFSNEEYLLLGSANITMAAMGNTEFRAANGEAGILMKRDGSSKIWIEELGIKLPKKSIELKKVQNRGIENSTVHRTNYKCKILYSELRGNEVTIYLNKALSEAPLISVLDRSDLNIENQIIRTDGEIVVARVVDPENTFRLTITDNESNRISNYCIVHRLDALLRCNPDPTQEKLNTLLEQDFSDGEGITDLLQYVDFNWADEDSKTLNKTLNNSSPIIIAAKEDEEVKEYEVLKAEEFNNVSLETILKQSGEFSNSTVKIAEFLNMYASGVFGKDDQYRESEEQKLFDDQDQEGEGGQAKNTRTIRTNGSKEKKAMEEYFNKLNNIYSKRLEPFLSTGALTLAPKNLETKTLITIRSISSILIALHLIQKKDGKQYTEVTNIIDESGDNITKEHSFIYPGSVGATVETKKGFFLNVLGKFLLLSSAGQKNYDFDILNQKLQNSQSQLFVHSIYLILNTAWKESESNERDLLLLNCMHFSGSNLLLRDGGGKELIDKLNRNRVNSDYMSPMFNDQLKHFSDVLLPSYSNWLKIYVDKLALKDKLQINTSDLSMNDIIFSSSIGFNRVKKIIRKGDSIKLNLSRPGYDFVQGDFLLKNVQYGTRCIIFKFLK
jgi:hypothetical protein